MLTRLFVLSFLTLLASRAFAQNASLAVFRGSVLACPVSTSVSLILENTSTGAQTIPAGTTMTLTYSAPVLRAPTVPAGVTANVSGNIVNVLFAQGLTSPARTGLTLNTQLDLQGLADGTPVSVSISVAP